MRKHSAQARFAMIARASLKHCGILKSSTKENLYLVAAKRMRLVKVTAVQAQGLDTLPFKWRIHLFACTQDANGKRKLEHEYFDSPQPFTRDNLSEAAADAHKEMCKALKSKLRSVAWIATPFGDDVDTELVFNLLDQEFDAWDVQQEINVNA